MAKKKQPEPVTEEHVQAKRAACGYQLSAAQCRTVLEAQAEHDATDPHDAPAEEAEREPAKKAEPPKNTKAKAD